MHLDYYICICILVYTHLLCAIAQTQRIAELLSQLPAEVDVETLLHRALNSQMNVDAKKGTQGEGISALHCQITSKHAVSNTNLQRYSRLQGTESRKQ